MTFDDWFAGHEKVVLQVSGGKDSMACLYLLRDYWPRLTVMWTNTGAALPETIAMMASIRDMVPHFMEVKSDQPAQIAEYGLPVDVLPIKNTRLGRSIQPNDEPRLQGSLECCAANIWFPMAQAVHDFGATLIIRGQRASERRRAPFQSGFQAGGVTVWFPIEDWTDEQVWAYLRSQGVDIPHYRQTQTSLDCWSCTAFLDENVGKMRYLRAKHPALWEQLHRNLGIIRGQVSRELADIDEALYAAS